MLRCLLAAVAAFASLALPAFADSLSRKIEATGDPRLDGILSNITWASENFSYAFPEKRPKDIPDRVGFLPLPGAQREIVRDAFRQLETFSNLKFQEKSVLDTDLKFAQWNHYSLLGRINAGVEIDGRSYSIQGQTWVSLGSGKYLVDTRVGSYSHRWWKHEIGHILGLEHPHNNFARRPEPLEFDNISHSLMSYRYGKKYHANVPGDFIFPTSYMSLDMLALQHLYGVNWTTNAGDTVYKFSPKTGDYWIDGKRQAGNPTNKLFLTLWDGGGTDTLDFSAYDTGGNFDMRPGRFSTPSEAQRVEFKPGEKAEGSIAMPFLPKGDPRALIENIVVGDGDNTIALNYAGNHVALGSGRNRIVEYPGTGKDVIENFGGDDTLDLCGYHVPGKMVHVKADGADTVVTVDQWPNDEIRLKGMTKGKPRLRIDCEEAVFVAHPAGLEGSSAAEIAAKAEELWKSGDYAKAVALALTAYEKNGDANAAYRLGTAYYGGYGVRKNLETAWRYLSIPALDNIRYALYYRGLILADPAFSGHDIAAARVALQKAGDMGVPEAAKALANLPGG